MKATTTIETVPRPLEKPDFASLARRATEIDHDQPAVDIAHGAPPLLVRNLLNDLAELARLLPGELRQGAWLNAYLVAAGMNQIVEDYLHPDPYNLNKAAKYLSQVRTPLGPLAAKASRFMGMSIMRLRSLRSAERHILAWQTDLAALVQQLTDKVANPTGGAPASPGNLLETGRALVASVEAFPPALRAEVLRLPSCFRSFDHQPADLERIVCEFAERWPDRRRALTVVGVRTSGNYLAPLYAAFLKAQGYTDVSVLTLRPGRSLLKPERQMLQALVRRQGLALIADDPPATGDSLVKVAEELGRNGIPSRSIILLLQIFGSHATLPATLKLKGYAAVLLLEKEWAIHKKLTSSAIQAGLAELLDPAITVGKVEHLPLPPRQWARSHARARYRVSLSEPAAGRQWEQQILVEGVGLGYFGEHSLAVARQLRQFLPETYGVRGGLLYRAWLPDDRRPLLTEPGERKAFVSAATAYTAARNRALAVGEDVSLRLFGQVPAWEVASNLLSRAFGRGWLLARVPLVDPLVKRILRVKRPSIIDGSMASSHWFVGEAGPENLLKVDFDERAFSNRDLYCYDPIFDLAGLAADHADDRLGDELRRAYEALSAEPIGAERWLLYQLVHLWDRERNHPTEASKVARANSRALQSYFAALFFEDLTPPRSGDLCAVDIDGVLETEPLGFPGLTPSGAMALRALTLHGYRPILATGRSLSEVRERCDAYRLAGGVAEYGAAIYNHYTGEARALLTEAQLADLDRLRSALGEIEGVRLDPDFRYAIRAYRLNGQGRRRSLTAEVVEAALARSGAGQRIRPIVGEAQTDFVATGIDKGVGLRALAGDLGGGLRIGNRKPLALAVGDAASDLPMFDLATLACAPANADSGVRSAGVKLVKLMKRPYQAGLALAVSALLGHSPGNCPVCRGPALSPEAHWLQTILAAQEMGTRSMVRQALRLSIRDRSA